jgi:AbiU2
MKTDTREIAYWDEYKVVRNEVYVAIESFYTWLETNQFASESPENYRKINHAATFWMIQLHGLQTTFFVTLGRLFDRDKRSHSIIRLLASTADHPEFFSKDAFASRRTAAGGGRPDYLDEYLKGVWEPSASDLTAMKDAIVPWEGKFNSVYKPIRDKIFAHRDFTLSFHADRLFGMSLIKDVDDLLYGLWDLMEALWQLYHNGTKPNLGNATYDYRRRIKDTTRAVLSGLSGSSSGD